MKNTNFFFEIYDKNDYKPKKALYTSFFSYNVREFPKKFLLSTATSYMGSVVFGGMMLGISLLNNFGTGMDFLSNSNEVLDHKFQSMQEFRKCCKDQIKSLHQNGTFVIKYSMSLGLINSLSNFLPTLNGKFTDLYGHKNLNFLFYCGIPLMTYLNFFHSPIYKKVSYSTLFPAGYYIYKKII